MNENMSKKPVASKLHNRAFGGPLSPVNDYDVTSNLTTRGDGVFSKFQYDWEVIRGGHVVASGTSDDPAEARRASKSAEYEARQAAIAESKNRRA